MLVLFDLDGVIVDSNEFWMHTASGLLQYHHIEYNEDIDATLYDLSLEEGLEYVNHKYHSTLTLQDIQDYIAYYFLNEVQMFEGMKAKIEALYQKGYELAILTSNDTLITKQLLERLQLDHYFKKIYGNQNKKDLGIYQQFNQDTIVIDDSAYVLNNALQANLKALGIYDPHSIENKEEIESLSNITWEDLLK